jgi:arylsulfatase A-like enzyme
MPLRWVVLSAWCGLVSGLLEVGSIILRKHTVDSNHFYWMSRHFVWLIPLTNLVVFLLLGVVLSLLVTLRHPSGRWFAARLLCALTLLPPVWAGLPEIYGPAGLLLVLGVATRLVPVLEVHAARFRRLMLVSFPVVAGVVLILAAAPWIDARAREWSQDARMLPSAHSSNVLLIVLDTVGAEHLSVHGYNRPTSPTIDELATRGIRFDRAQATSSWTLPSHASMFTGRWPHELSAGWLTPLDGAHPTLAEFLGSRGYATAGFAANHWYCAADSGLARGFVTYQDYSFPRLTAFKMAVVVRRLLDLLREGDRFLEYWLDLGHLKPVLAISSWLLESDQKAAAEVNDEFLDWLLRRRQAERPFFAFLNFNDAHHPYSLPRTSFRRFQTGADDVGDGDPIEDELLRSPQGPSKQQIAPVSNAYDDCIASLDEQLGLLLDELDRRRVLERTWVIITSDHGESFGEHPRVFRHGMSLYQTERHVPLMIIPPSGQPSARVVAETVSLRDVPATVVDLLDLEAGSPFPGNSLTRFWDRSSSEVAIHRASPGPALSELVPLDPFDAAPEHVGKLRWPLAALTEGDWTYIRREEDFREELFRLGDDAGESLNLADVPALQSTLQHMRGTLNQLTAGPLTPRRFPP